jgi:hypothetical protein
MLWYLASILQTNKEIHPANQTKTLQKQTKHEHAKRTKKNSNQTKPNKNTNNTELLAM